ncbi:hypothetical protein Pcinc_031004 [Petrolisthes cinctipes]|uniref:Rap guanine nucleotide exchange factor 2 n=1 Tax=Petrolisthes cinctipes TaxID=88211 RepID=A0AAE1EXI5_PETCI|nr:hypothetical protein Pcinc_031004 [Petrolisthes cinctipes]
MTLAVRKAMCSAMVFAVVDVAGTVLMKHGEELDSWSVIINGHVEVTLSDSSLYELHLGDSFGITPTMEKLYHQGEMRSKVEDCQFVCIRQTDYYRILHQSEENIRRVEEDGVLVLVSEQRPIDAGNRKGNIVIKEDGVLVLVSEQRPIDAGNRKGNIVIKGTSDRLMQQLVEVENNIDPTYVEDFLLTHRTFIESPLVVANKLLQWFEDPSLRDRVTRVVLLWVNNHFTDFEMDPNMMNFLEQFEEGLEREKMAGQLRLLDFACATKARARTVTLTRPSRDEVLHFSILGGYERGFSIFISQVEKGSKAEDVGLKRGDQILEVNGQSFDHMTHAKALEILRQTCHLSITVKSNLLAFKEMLMTPENSPRPRSRKPSDVRALTDPNTPIPLTSTFSSTMNLPADHTLQQSPRDKSGKLTGNNNNNNNNKGSLTNKANKIKRKVIESLKSKNNALDSQMNSDDSVSSQSSVGGGLYHSHSNPDLSTTLAFEEATRAEFPEHVLKVYRATDQAARFLPVHKETTAREVVMLALQIFNISDPTGSSNYALYEVTVTEEGITKQKRLPDSLQNLAERIGLSSRYYLKNITVGGTLFPDDIVNDLIRESTVYFLQLNAVELAVQLTLEDYTVFRQIEPTEYIDYLFHLKSNYGTPALTQFAEIVNREMFWVVTEVCSEHNLIKRVKTIKQYIKVARQCKECKNFNSMFAILSGLGHGSVSRLKQTWERRKYTVTHCKYNEIPFHPVVARDLTFTHEGNDDKVEGLINFEKLRMISRYIRDLQNMCSAPYDLFNIQDSGGGQAPSSALISLNQMASGGGNQIATVKRRKKSTAAPDKKKMYEEAQMVRRVKAYLSRMSIIFDEEQLRSMSLECEAGAEGGHKSTTSSLSSTHNNNNNNNNNGGGSNSAPPTNPQPRRRTHSPTPSTTSSTSSTSQTSDGKKQTTKFGATSPQSISKMKALAEPKTKPHHGPRSNNTNSSLSPNPSPGPPRRASTTSSTSTSTNTSTNNTSTNNSSSNSRSNHHHHQHHLHHHHHHHHHHERSHSDTPHAAVPVDLSAESSSVTSLSKLHKSHTSGMPPLDTPTATTNPCQPPHPLPPPPPPPSLKHTSPPPPPPPPSLKHASPPHLALPPPPLSLKHASPPPPPLPFLKHASPPPPPLPSPPHLSAPPPHPKLKPHAPPPPPSPHNLSIPACYPGPSPLHSPPPPPLSSSTPCHRVTKLASTQPSVKVPSSSSSSSSLSFVHAASCSQLITSMRNMSLSGSHLHVKRIHTASNISTPIVSSKQPRILPSHRDSKNRIPTEYMPSNATPIIASKQPKIMSSYRENKKSNNNNNKALTVNRMSTSFDSSYGSIGSDNEHAKSTERPAGSDGKNLQSSGCLVPLARHPKQLKTIGKHGMFSRSLPAPNQGESESGQSSSSIRNLTFKIRDVAEFKTSTPVPEIMSELNVKPGKHSTNVGSPFQGVKPINRSTEACSQDARCTSVCSTDVSSQIAVSCPSGLSQTHTVNCKECPSHSVPSVMPYPLQETTQPLNIPRSRVSYAGCSSSTQTHAVNYNNKETPGGLNSSSHIPPRRSESFGELRQERVLSLVTNPQQRETAVGGSNSSPPRYSNMFQDYLHNKQKLNYNPKSSSSSSKGFFNRIFRSRSEAVLNEDSSWFGSAPSTPLEAILSPVLTRSLFRRSRSESVLNQTVDNPELKKYRLDDSECVDVTAQVMTTKPIYTHSISLDSQISTANNDIVPKTTTTTTTKPFYAFFGGTGATSLGDALKKRMKRRKCHSVSNDDTCQPSSSRFFLEKKLPGQEAEIRETKHHTLERNPADKETYFPSAPKTVKKNEPQRIYKVNEPRTTPKSISILGRAHGREDNVHKDKFTGTYGVVSNTHEFTNSKDIPLVMTWMEDSSGKSSNNILHHFSNYFPPQKKLPWFAKFQISKQDRCKEETQSNRLDESFCSSVFSHSSEGSNNSGHDSLSGMSGASITNSHLQNPDYLGVPFSVNHSPVNRSPERPFSSVGQSVADLNSQFVMSEYDSDSLSETVSLLVKYKGRPEVQKRVAEKLNTIIRDLEREMNLTPPNSPLLYCRGEARRMKGRDDGNGGTAVGEHGGDRGTVVGIQRSDSVLPPSSSSPPPGKTHDCKPTLSKSRSFDETTVDFDRDLDACHHSLGNILTVSSATHGGSEDAPSQQSLGNIAKESSVCGRSGNIARESYACEKVGNVATESRALGKFDSFNQSLGNSLNAPSLSELGDLNWPSSKHSQITTYTHTVGNVTNSFTSPSPLDQNSPLPSLSSQNGEVQPRSLVHPAPTTFCDQYGNEHEIAYV